MPIARRGMLLNDLTCHDENFWPSIHQVPDGNIYLVNGGRTSLVKVEGLDSIRRLPDSPLRSARPICTAPRRIGFGARRPGRKPQGQEISKVAMLADAPTVDGRLDDWRGADWVTVDRRGVAAYFDSKSKPYDIAAAVAVAGDRLYAAFRTNEPNLLANSGEIPRPVQDRGGPGPHDRHEPPGRTRSEISRPRAICGCW